MPAGGARESWTDERLDDLARRMDTGFAELSARIDRQGAALGARIDRQGERIDGLGDRIDALQRTLLQIGGGLIASILVGAAGIAATQV